MKPWPSTDRSGPDRAAAGEYVGRTAQEALSKAAAALGPSAELRCWKTRRGGVGGFFATEVYVPVRRPRREPNTSGTVLVASRPTGRARARWTRARRSPTPRRPRPTTVHPTR